MHKLLSSSDDVNWKDCIFQFWQVFIGLSFPYEGPGPLEAIAQGSVFINPKVGM